MKPICVLPLFNAQKLEGTVLQILLVIGVTTILIVSAAAEENGQSSQAVLAANVSNLDDSNNRGLGMHIGFLRRFAHLALGGETDYIRERSSGTETGNFWFIAGALELSPVRPRPRSVVPYLTGSLGLVSWTRGFDSESNYVWAWGVGAQYWLTHTSNSSVFIQMRSFRVLGDEDSHKFPMVLITAGYRFGL
jgi:hypothetical protein